MIVTVLDERLSNARLMRAATEESGDRLFWVPQTLPIVDIIEGIKNAAGQERRIRLLRISAHGNRAFIELGRDNLDPLNVMLMKTLRDYFTEDAIGIALHSCGPVSATSIRADTWSNEVLDFFRGEDTSALVPGRVYDDRGQAPGFNFIKKMAQITNVPVRGSIHSQLADTRWIFEGDTVVASPSGHASYIAGGGKYVSDTTRIIAL